MSPTNAQAALQAAATVYSGGRGMTTRQAVVNLAESFKAWLDAQDSKDQVQADKLAKTVEADKLATLDWHRQDTDIKGHPVCSCGWDPRDHYRNLNGQDAARGLIRQHAARHTPPRQPLDGPLEGPPRPATRLTGHPDNCP